MRRRFLALLPVFMAATLLAGCFSPQGNSPAEKRQATQLMRSNTLERLHELEPGARAQIGKAQGYAVFSNVGVNLILLSTGGGWGVAHDNETGKDTYMKMVTGGIGIGLGIKDFRGVFVFATREAMNNFIEHGWEAGGQADAAAKAGDKGGAYAGAVTVAPGVKLYQITASGLALQATIQGTKYWKDDELNGG